MLRLSSYGSSTSTGTGTGTQPPSPTPRRVDPLDSDPPRHDVLQVRARELHKLVSQLATWFTHVAQLHHHHALALDKLDPLPVPFSSKSASSNLFIPLTEDQEAGTPPTLGGTGREGWQDIFAQANSTQSRIASQHAQLAKQITADVVNPLNKLAFELKTHAQLLEKELKPLVDAVQRERHLVQSLYTRLANAIALVQQPAAAATSSLWGVGNKGPKPLSPHDDPVLVRAQIQARLRVQLDREHDLLSALKKCTHKSLDRELSAFDQVKQCWSTWESLHSASLLESHQLGMFLAATVDAVPNDKEWHHFAAVDKGLTVPDDEPDRTLDDLEWVGKGHELTRLVKEGLLERQTSILKSWKPAYFILTPSGILHVYTPPASSVVLPDPTTSPSSPAEEEARASLSPIAHYLALHASPQFSLNLSHCFLGPMPTPSPALPPPSSSSPVDEEPSAAAAVSPSSGKKKPVAALDAVFTLIEATVSNGGKDLTMPTSGGGTRHVVRCRGENGWEEMGGWVAEIGKYCAVPSVPPPPSPPTPIAPVMATTTTTTTAADEPPSNNNNTTTTTDEAAAAAAAAPPATVLARSLPPLPPSRLPPPPALPERTGSAFTLSGHGPPPPALPPRDSFLSQASSSSSSAGGEMMMGDDSMFSTTEGEGNQSYGDMSHVMASFGLLGAGAGAGAGAGVGAGVGVGVGVANANADREGDDDNTPATTVHEGDTDAEQNAADDEEEKKEEEEGSTEGEGEGDESGGDLGRSVPEDDDDSESVTAASSAAKNDDNVNESGSGSKVKNLAAAWEQQGGGGDDQKKGGEEEETAAAGLTVPKGKKGKKKRKSKGGKDSTTATAGGSQEDKALPTPSDDPESSDLGMPSPHSTAFESAPSSPKPDAHASPESDPEHEYEQNVDLGEPEEEEKQKKDGEEEDGASKPPMELEEVVEAPEQDEHEHEHEHADADAQPADENEQHKSEHDDEHDHHH